MNKTDALNQLPANHLVLDANNLNRLKLEAKANSPEALKETAKQFEAMLLNMMLKSMRDAAPQDGMLDSEQTRTYTAMLDQQLSQHLANKGIGLADALVKQLAKTTQSNVTPTEIKPTSQRFSQTFPYQAMNHVARAVTSETESVQTPDLFDIQPTIVPLATETKPSFNQMLSHTNLPDHVRAFGQRMGASAERASQASGIPSAFLLGQAALESGWGKSEIKYANGSSSHNLFGIKANDAWQGKVVSATTSEYINGIKQQRVEKFRAYDSYDESFKDFANLIASNPRYQNALSHLNDASAYTSALQKGGYATDPQYAKKLTRVIEVASAVSGLGNN